MDAITKMYRAMYWSQVFSLKTSLSVKWLAIRSLFILRGIGDISTNIGDGNVC